MALINDISTLIQEPKLDFLARAAIAVHKVHQGWHHLSSRLSAGMVQSVVIHLILKTFSCKHKDLRSNPDASSDSLSSQLTYLECYRPMGDHVLNNREK